MATEEELKKLMDEIVEVEKTASIDLEECDWRVRAGMSIAKAQAKEHLEELTKCYSTAIASNTFSIFVMGDKGDEFARISDEESRDGVIVLRADAIYRKIAERVEESLGLNREFGITQMGLVIRGLSELARDLDIKAFDTPKFLDNGPMKDSKAVLNHVRQVIRHTLGDDLNRISLTKEITKKALELRYTYLWLPVVVLGLEDDDEVSNLSSITAYFGTKVVTPEVVNKDYVTEVFKGISEKIKNEKKTE